jgi:hypothetical protein
MYFGWQHRTERIWFDSPNRGKWKQEKVDLIGTGIENGRWTEVCLRFATRESGGIAIRILVKQNSLGYCSVRRNGDRNGPRGGWGRHSIDTSANRAPLFNTLGNCLQEHCITPRPWRRVTDGANLNSLYSKPKAHRIVESLQVINKLRTSFDIFSASPCREAAGGDILFKI